MFSDPQSVTVNGSAVSLPRVSTGDNRATYQSADGNRRLVVSSAYGRRIRRTARLEYRKVAPDPLFPSQNAPFTTSFYVVTDAPLVGFTQAELGYEGAALMSWLTASTNANLLKMLAGES